VALVTVTRAELELAIKALDALIEGSDYPRLPLADLARDLVPPDVALTGAHYQALDRVERLLLRRSESLRRRV
jgi:hypothetical protein